MNDGWNFTQGRQKAFGLERIALERAPRHVNTIIIHNTNNVGFHHKASVERKW